MILIHIILVIVNAFAMGNLFNHSNKNVLIVVFFIANYILLLFNFVMCLFYLGLI
jgi:hypothetical protein